MYRSPLVSGWLIFFICLQPVWQVHRQAKSDNPQGTLALLPPRPPVVKNRLMAATAELTDPAPFPLAECSHGRGRFILEQNELKILKLFPQEGNPFGKLNGWCFVPWFVAALLSRGE